MLPCCGCAPIRTHHRKFNTVLWFTPISYDQANVRAAAIAAVASGVTIGSTSTAAARLSCELNVSRFLTARTCGVGLRCRCGHGAGIQRTRTPSPFHPGAGQALPSSSSCAWLGSPSAPCHARTCGSTVCMCTRQLGVLLIAWVTARLDLVGCGMWYAYVYPRPRRRVGLCP